MPTIKLRIPSNKTLGNICVYGAMASVTAVMYMRWKMQDRIRQQEYYRLAFKTLRSHKGAIDLLGEPIKDNGFDFSNVNNSCDGQKAQFEVKVHGPRDKGTIYFWATNEHEAWKLDRLELETKLNPEKRFLLSQRKTKLIKSDNFTEPELELLKTTH